MPHDDTLLDDDVGSRIRAARKAQGVSLRSVASAVGVSASLLSLVENGRTKPSVSTLTALVTHLGISFDDILGEPVPAPEPRARQSSAARIPLAYDQPFVGEPSFVQRAEENTVIARTGGVRWERLSALGAHPVESLLVTLAPGAHFDRHPDAVAMTGAEHVYLVSGVLTLRHQGASRLLRAGDSLALPPGAARSFHNEGARPARGVWLLVGLPATAA